jgi:hypothetical protein
MNVGDGGIDNVNTGFQHLRGRAERLGSGGDEGVWETGIAGDRLNDVAVEILNRTGLGDHRHVEGTRRAALQNMPGEFVAAQRRRNLIVFQRGNPSANARMV